MPRFLFPRPEVLAPAGSMLQLACVTAYGADAVYLAGPGPQLRAPRTGFAPRDLARALSLAHGRGARAYLCLNAFPPAGRFHEVRPALEMLADDPDRYPVDALIVADPGVFALAREIVPDIPIHVSTQANTTNAAAAAFWLDAGASRVNLARELSMGDIRALAAELGDPAPGRELEMFVHGAMCLAVSGRCLLSDWMGARPANQGECTQPCRWAYRPLRAAFEEGKRAGRPSWEIEEHGGFSTILAPADLCLVGYLAWIWRRGIRAVKIEGRMRAPAQAALAVNVYATALADLAAGRFRRDLFEAELAAASGRPLSTGFFLPHQRLETGPLPRDMRRPAAAIITGVHGDPGGESRAWDLAVRSRVSGGEGLELLLPGLGTRELAAGGWGLRNGLERDVDLLHPGQEGRLVALGPDSLPHAVQGMILRRVSPGDNENSP